MTSDKGNTSGEEAENRPPGELHDIASLAVLLHGEMLAKGKKPSEAEIWAWMHGELSEHRGAEVKSHVARNPDIYSIWHSLRMSTHEPQIEEQGVSLSTTAQEVEIASEAPELSWRVEESFKAPERIWSTKFDVSKRLADFFKPSPAIGFATIASLSVVVFALLQNREPPVEFWQDWQVPKAQLVDDSAEDQMAYRSVLAGMSATMQELSIPTLAPDGTRLPTVTSDCEQAQNNVPCTQTHQALYLLGQLVTEARLVCFTLYAMPEEKQERLRGIATELANHREGKPFVGPIDQWLAGDNDNQRCAAVNTIIDRALRGLSN